MLLKTKMGAILASILVVISCVGDMLLETNQNIQFLKFSCVGAPMILPLEKSRNCAIFEEKFQETQRPFNVVDSVTTSGHCFDRISQINVQTVDFTLFTGTKCGTR